VHCFVVSERHGRNGDALCGRGSCGNLRWSSLSNEVNVVRKGSGADGDQRARADACHRRYDDQVAQRTGVGSRIGMVMPNRS
jgi:hypothetical protein